jgi:hypothetical protein
MLQNRPKSTGNSNDAKFTENIPVQLTSGKTLGKYGNGSTINAIGKSVQEVLKDIALEYLPPAFSSFSMQGQATTVEVGTVISGLKNFTWSISNNANVQANSITVTDVTNNANLTVSIANDGSENINVGSVTKSIKASNQWRASAINTLGTTLQSSVFTVNWYFKRFVGTSSNATLTEAQIEALTGTLGADNTGTYALAAGGYKYLCFPDSYGNQATTTGFKDTATGFPVAMADNTDNIFFSNVQNGWYYGLVAVTNALGVTENYRVYRSKNILGGSINIQVS